MKVCDITVNLLKEVCSNVCQEPSLQALSSESLQHVTACRENEVRLDLAEDGFSDIPNQRSFFDVKIVNPFPQTYKDLPPLAVVYSRLEAEKKV